MECIGIYSRQNATLNYYFQKKAGAKWSRTCRCWYISCTEKNYEQLCTALRGIATIEVEELRIYLMQRKKSKTNISASVNKISKQSLIVKTQVQQLKSEAQLKQLMKLSPENSKALQEFK